MCASASGCRLQSSYSNSIVSSSLKSNWHLAASCQLPIHTNRRISIWLPFAGFLSSFYCFKPSQIELAPGCQLPIHTNRRISIWLPFAGFLSSFYCFKPSQIELASGCQLPVASCQFSQTGELASGCRLPVSYLAFIVLNPLKSNWHLAASCQLPIHTNRRISIWLPFAGFLSSFYCFKPSQIELASGCQLPVASSEEIVD